jgi:multiple sugar transport system permease protein
LQKRTLSLQSRHDSALFAKTRPTLFLAPTFVGALIAVAIPIFVLGVLSLVRWDMISPMQWQGLSNFTQALTDAGFIRSLANSSYISILATTLQLALGTAGGYFLWTRENRLVSASYLLPWFAAPIAMGVIWKWLLTPESGLLSNLLGHRIELLSSASLAPFAIAGVSAWLGFGYTALFIATGLRSMPQEMLEAARLDGANARQVFWSVQLPQLRALGLLLMVSTSLQTMCLFDIIYVLTGGGPLGATDTAALHIVNSALYQFDIGGSSAMAIVFTTLEASILIVQVLVYRRVTRRFLD